MQTAGLASNRSVHFGIRKQIITKLRATDSIVNTDKGTRVFYSCDRSCQRMIESHYKIKYVGKFSRLKILSLTLQREKKNMF